MGAAVGSKVIPLVEPFQCFADWGIAEFDSFTLSFATGNYSLGISEAELGRVLADNDLTQDDLASRIFAAFRDNPTAEASKSSKDAEVINALSLLAGLCLIQGMNEGMGTVEQVKDIHDVFNLQRNSGLSLAETTILVYSTCRSLEIMTGFVNEGSQTHVSMAIAESIAQMAFRNCGKSDDTLSRSRSGGSDSLISSDEFAAFIMSKFTGREITVEEVHDDVAGDTRERFEAFDIMQALPQAYDIWGWRE